MGPVLAKARIEIARLAPALSWLLPGGLLAVSLALLTWELKRPSAVLLFWPAWAETGALAAALTAIMLTGGIDLSLGSVIALSSVVLGRLWCHAGWSIWLASAAAVAAGLLAGAGNALLIVAGIPSLIATLATLAFYGGLAMALSAGQRISGLPGDFTRLAQEDWLRLPGGAGLPNQLWLLLLVFLMAYVFVHRTRFGRYLYAMGNNRLAARFAGIPINRLEASLYMASGGIAALVGVCYAARTGAAIPNAGQGRELEAIACVVLGGTRVTGGAGGVLRTALGVAVIAHLDIALQLASSLAIVLPGTDVVWQPSANSRLVILGAIMIAVAIWNERIPSKPA
jgi:ribose/xylose/arabinose/galactoside ABC-type transport system permease subunit